MVRIHLYGTRKGVSSPPHDRFLCLTGSREPIVEQADFRIAWRNRIPQYISAGQQYQNPVQTALPHGAGTAPGADTVLTDCMAAQRLSRNPGM